MTSNVRLACLVTHPIQYQAPLLRRIALERDISLTVFFCSDFSVRKFMDPEFGRVIEWGVPLLDGYRYEFLPAVGGQDKVSFWRPFNYGLADRLKSGKFDVLWIHGYARWFHWVAVITAKYLGVKVLIRDDPTLISARRGLVKIMLKRAFFYWLNLFCDGFLYTGSLNRKYYQWHGIKQDKMFFMPHAVDNRYFRDNACDASRDALRKEIGLDKGRPVILYAGKMTEKKRPGDLLEAYIRLSPDGTTEPHPYLLFVGDGEKRDVVEKRALQSGWSSVRFLGFRNQSELRRYYDLCDVFVLPSFYENWGLVVNEAMNLGCAVIVSDRVGCGPDLVKNGENGYIFRVGDIDDLCRKLRDVLADSTRCRTLGQKSREIINKWSFEEDVSGLREAIGFAQK